MVAYFVQNNIYVREKTIKRKYPHMESWKWNGHYVDTRYGADQTDDF